MVGNIAVVAATFTSLSCANAAVLEKEGEVSGSLSQLLDKVSETLLNPHGDHNIDAAMEEVENHMDLESAAKEVSHRHLSTDVRSLVQSVSHGQGDAGFAQKFDEASLEKARLALNDLMEKAWTELDDKLMDCKGFEDMNRNNFDIVTRDIARLVEQINDLERVESESVEGINQKDTEIRTAEDLLDEETTNYNTEYAANSATLTIYQNDLDVFQFILTFTKCEDATSLAQIRVCHSTAGKRTFAFANETTNAELQRIMTPNAKKAIHELLSSLIQQPLNSTEPPMDQDAVPVVDGMSTVEASLSCSPDSVPDCGLLHDKLSLMWGEFKDKVDELTMTMMKNEYEFMELKANLNSQIELLKSAKARLNQLLGETRSNLAADNEELKQKYIQKAQLDKQYVKFMSACKKRINWIFYQDLCAIKIVRNAVMENSTKCPTRIIRDCRVSDWVAKECSVECDDSCNPRQPYKCGGWQEMKRRVIVNKNRCGVSCPRLSLFKRCNQFKCPVDCAMSEWSGWSKCTAECGGGVQSHTRSILVRPKNGGMACNTVEESQPCATESCDRNCILSRWTRWTPCTMACGGGWMERFRHVLIPTRGFGKCPKADSNKRYRKARCNVHPCRGDEICIANQDLVIAVDGSGSIREDGFNVLKQFVSKLLSKYHTNYFGHSTTKIGIVLFGNGVIMPDGTVSPAIISQQLTFDLTAVTAAVNSLPYKKGFTNMAQGFSAAENVLIQGSRRGSQSAIMVITDGKPSFNFMTSEMVEQLDDKAIDRYMFLINSDDMESDANKLMRSWASQPWQSSVVHVPGGLELLESDPDLWANAAVIKFCPQAYSPFNGAQKEQSFGFMLVKRGGWCGEQLDENLVSTNVDTPEQCASLVTARGGQSFYYGRSFADGKCYKGTMEVSEELYTTWKKTRRAQAGPACEEGDGWHTSTLYDFYALEPVAAEED